MAASFSQEKKLLWLSPFSLFPNLASNQLVCKYLSFYVSYIITYFLYKRQVRKEGTEGKKPVLQEQVLKQKLQILTSHGLSVI